jgi:hypothetical protein
MRFTPSSTVAALLAFVPWYAYAQDAPAAPAATTEAQPYTPPDDRVQAELKELRTEIEKLRAEQTEREVANGLAQERELTDSERKVRVYGFGDVGVSRATVPSNSYWQQTFPRPLSFYLGRLNLYFDAKPDPDFRVLVETRFSFYPHGSSSGFSSTGQNQPTTTAVSDYSSSNPWAQVNWGSIIIERAVVDWTRYQLFSVRAGVFLSPFGIYNVDHGSPTIISVTLPTYLTLGWVPTRQIGIQVFGTLPIDRWELGYSGTIANGQNPDGVRDVADSKALGGRLFVRRLGELGLLLGASGLYRPYRRDTAGFVPDSTGAMAYQVARIVENQQLTLGVDQSLDYAGLRIRNELVYYSTQYTAGKRDSFMGLPGLTPDTRQFNWSLLAAYRYKMLEPYALVDYFYCSPAFGWSTVWQPGAGVNIHLSSNVILKTSWLNVRFYRDNMPTEKIHVVNGLLVVAF